MYWGLFNDRISGIMIEKLKEFFDGDLDVEDIRKVSDVSDVYEIDTKGYYYIHNGYQIPTGLFRHMHEFGLGNFQILNPQDGKLVGLWEMEYLITIRFTVENEELFNDMMGV